MKELNAFLLTLNSEHDFQTAKIENDVITAQKLINEASELSGYYQCKILLFKS